MKKRIFNVILFTLLLLLILFLSIKFLDFIGYKCFYRKYFNIYCAGCGATRMFKSIFKFKFYKAFRYNPLVFMLLIVFIIYFIYAIFIYVKENKLLFPSFKVIIFIIILLFIYMILRNISYFSFLLYI